MTRKLEKFSKKYHEFGKRRSTIIPAARYLAALQNISRFSPGPMSARLASLQQGGSTYVDLALKLNVLAVFAVFAFVGAILLGAF
jgi:hypothetical protein